MRLLGFLFALCFLSLRVVCAEAVLRVGMFPNVTHAQALIARNMSREGNGWFEKRLGDVRIEWFVYNAGPSAMEGIFTKAIDLTYVGPSPAVNAYARANGKEVRVVSGAMRGGEALVVHGDAIRTPDDFRGKTIATPQLGNTQDVECRAWLIEHGIKVTLVGGDARVIPTANPDMLLLFQQGRLDAAWTVEPWVSRLLDSGARIFFADEAALTTILVARAAFLDEQAEMARKFVAAHRELTEWIRANPEEAQRRVRNELTAITRREIPIELIKQAWTRLALDSAISVEPFEKFLEQARQVGFLRAEINLDSLVVHFE
jgi:NitT/TauT family transport system substrate-binding protein